MRKKKTWVQKLKEKAFRRGVICCLIFSFIVFLLIEFIPVEIAMKRSGVYDIKLIQTKSLPGNSTIINQTYKELSNCSEPYLTKSSFTNLTYLDCGLNYFEINTSNPIPNETMKFCKELYYLYCVNRLFDGWKGDLNCGEREPQTVSETITTKRGCCKDATRVYEFFLDKQNITNQNIAVPKHIFNLAVLEIQGKNKTSYKYYRLDQILIREI